MREAVNHSTQRNHHEIFKTAVGRNCRIGIGRMHYGTCWPCGSARRHRTDRRHRLHRCHGLHRCNRQYRSHGCHGLHRRDGWRRCNRWNGCHRRYRCHWIYRSHRQHRCYRPHRCHGRHKGWYGCHRPSPVTAVWALNGCCRLFSPVGESVYRSGMALTRLDRLRF